MSSVIWFQRVLHDDKQSDMSMQLLWTDLPSCKTTLGPMLQLRASGRCHMAVFYAF